MIFKKIQLGKKSTMNVVYENGDCDTITMSGANVVHRDFKDALKSLVPHLALLTEQKESYGMELEELREQKVWEENGVYNRISVNGVEVDGDDVVITGTRILDRGDIIKLSSPKLSMVDDDKYQYLSDLQLDVEAVKYEAGQYVKERKWGLKEGNLFEDVPFGGTEVSVSADDVPQVSVEVVTDEQPKKK